MPIISADVTLRAIFSLPYERQQKPQTSFHVILFDVIKLRLA